MGNTVVVGKKNGDNIIIININKYIILKKNNKKIKKKIL